LDYLVSKLFLAHTDNRFSIFSCSYDNPLRSKR
jgi:hypothetical protein